MKENSDLDPRLERRLSALEPIPQRDPRKAAEGRAAFLKLAQELGEPVSSARPARLNSWIAALSNPFQLFRKEHPKMFSTITSILLIVAVLFGGSGATLAAAQTSLPDQPLYAIKLLGEEVQLSLTNQEQARLELSLQYVERRMAEIQTMLKAGNPPDDAAVLRLQNQIENTLRLCIQQSSEGQQVQALQQLQTRLMTHLQTLAQLRAGSGEAAGVLTRLQSMIQQRLQWVEAGLQDPVQLRTRLQQQKPVESPAGGNTPGKNGTTAPGQGNGAGATQPCPNCTPVGTSQGSNPWTTGTPTPGSSGPGPQPTMTRMPNTNPTQTVMPQATHTPQQNGTPQGPGPQPTSPGGKP